MNHVAMLRIGNEIDFIEELMNLHIQHFDTIYLLEDSDDGTSEVVKSYPQVIYSKTIEELSKEIGIADNIPNKEWVRQIVLEQIIKDWGEGTWITFLHGDEILYYCPIQLAQLGEALGWKATVWEPMHFFLHSSQRASWESEWANKPILERLQWYCPGSSQTEWPGFEVKQIRATSDLKYVIGEKFKYYPTGVEDSTNPPPYPLYLHLGYRNPQQTMERVRKNFIKGFQPMHRGLLSTGPFVDCLDGIDEVRKFTGDFEERELHNLNRYFECEHSIVKEKS